MKLRYGEIHVGEFDDRNAFLRWCRDRCEEAWQRVEEPAADAPPLVLVHLFDPIEQEAVTHIHSPEVAWFQSMPRRHELAQRIGVMVDLAPIRHVAWMLTSITLRHSGDQAEFDARHRDILGLYGSLTKAWHAGVEGVGEIAQIAAASLEGATAWSADIIREPDKAPRLRDWHEADAGSTDGPLIDPIQEALDAS